MATQYEIPTTPESQTFTAKLGNYVYSVNLYFCPPANVWVIDLADDANNPILSGIPLITGIDLLAPYTYLNFGGQLIALTDSSSEIPPTQENLGTTGHLRFVTA